MKLLIYIPARSGSKGIQNKNIKKIGTKTLLEISYEFAKKIPIKNKLIFVSTDNKNYLQKKYNKFNYLRPKKYSKDTSEVLGGIFHCLNFLKKKNINPTHVLLLQPTSPFRKIKEITAGIKLMKSYKFKSLVGVSKMKEHPFECLKKTKNKFYPLVDNNFRKNYRQSYPDRFYFIDGSLYLAELNFLLKKKSFFDRKHTHYHELTSKVLIDIDEKKDLEFANLVQRHYYNNKI